MDTAVRLGENELAAAANAAVPRLDDAEREDASHRRVDRVPSRAKNPGSNPCSSGVLSGDDTGIRNDRRSRDRPAFLLADHGATGWSSAIRRLPVLLPLTPEALSYSAIPLSATR